MSDSAYNFFFSAPKVELHIHFDGAFDMDLLYEIAKRDLDQLPETVPAPWNGPDATIAVRSAIAACKNKEDFKKITCLGPEAVVSKRLQTGQKGAGLACMLDCFAILTPVVQGKRDVMEEMAFKVCERQYRENVVYTELRYNPHVLALEGSTLPDARSVVEAVTAGIERGKKVFGIDMNQILCCMNLMPEVSAEVAQLAIEFKSKGVVAIDVAAGENHFENEDLKKAHVAACLEAEKAGLRVTVHGAEDGSSKNFCCAVREYHAERVGHAYKIASDPEMYKMAQETHTHIEACPTSSICTEAVCLPQIHPEKPILDSLDWNKHPIKKFIEDGLSVSISTDDPTVFLTHITDELTILADRFGFDAHEVGMQVTMNAIDRCWATDKEKSKYREAAVAYYKGAESTRQ